MSENEGMTLGADGVMRAANLNAFLDELREGLDLPEGFDEASNEHDYSCDCAICWRWWKTMGPDEDGFGDPFYGPFGDELYGSYAEWQENNNGDGTQ